MTKLRLIKTVKPGLGQAQRQGFVNRDLDAEYALVEKHWRCRCGGHNIPIRAACHKCGEDKST